MDPDPNWAKILYPDLNSMYLDPQHCIKYCNTGIKLASTKKKNRLVPVGSYQWSNTFSLCTWSSA